VPAEAQVLVLRRDLLQLQQQDRVLELLQVVHQHDLDRVDQHLDFLPENARRVRLRRRERLRQLLEARLRLPLLDLHVLRLS